MLSATDNLSNRIANANERIAAATDLDGLLGVLNDLDYETLKYMGNDLTDLPTYGGTEPGDTSEVWSWDADRLIVSGNQGYEIVNREDAEWAEA